MNLLALAVARLFFVQEVNVTMNAPDRVKGGEEFTVSFTISKGAVAGVALLKLILPTGISNASVVEAKGAEFKYLPEDNVVKFTWISLPEAQEFTVSYKATVNTDAPDGIANLGGKFSYVLNNEKQTYLISDTPLMIGTVAVATTTTTEPTVQPETTTVTTATTAATQPETTITTPEVKLASEVIASRNIVGSPEAGMEFTVDLTIKKGAVKGFARIQEILPAGLTAMTLNSKGGTFSFMDQKVKIIWDNLPADEEVKVSYRIAVDDALSGDMAISGSFSYVENDEPKKVDIPPTTITVKPKTALVVKTETTTVTPPETTTVVSVPTPEKKVAFKVQICALSKLQRAASYFESKYAIGSKVNMEFHEGWRKYIVGKYNLYQDARDYRETVRAKGVENPFVTAYSNGKRVTVQEGLMVSNQKWVR